MDAVNRSALVPLCLLVICSLTSVRCHIPVIKGFIGLDVLLPCVYREEDPLPDRVSIYWRDKDDNIVLDIISSSPEEGSQDQMFRGRVKTFPELYKKGNFSIVLRKLQHTDAGLYECHVPVVDFQVKVELKVSGQRAKVAGAAATTTRRPVQSAHNAAGGLKSLHLTLLSLPVSVLLC